VSFDETKERGIKKFLLSSSPNIFKTFLLLLGDVGKDPVTKKQKHSPGILCSHIYYKISLQTAVKKR